MADIPQVISIPSDVQTALEGILTDVYNSEMREDIITAITWGIENSITVAQFLNDLGLCVKDGLLCYTTENVLTVYNGIPSNVQAVIDRIRTDVYGPELRKDIVYVLKWAGDYVGAITGLVDSLGLTVMDGKLCAIYGVET